MAQQHEEHVEQDPTLTSLAAANALTAVNNNELRIGHAGQMDEGGMTVALSTAANTLPEGHQLFWFTVSKVGTDEPAAQAVEQDEQSDENKAA